MVRIKDVAVRAGVSISTVSNVINKTKYVSSDLVERVNEAIADLGYEVNAIAASMKSKKSKTIGVITEDMCGVFYPYIVRGISTIADEKGYKIIICDINGAKGKVNAATREQELFDKLLASHVDGIIFVSSMSGSGQDKYFVDLKRKSENGYKKTPIVSLERDLTTMGIDSVYFDNYHNAQKAVQHLVECGCKKICHIAGPIQLQIVKERVDGYIKCLKKHNIPFDRSTMISYGDYTHPSGYIAMQTLLKNIPDLDGVFCSNDQMAIGALRVLKEHGISVPEQVKLIGYDDVFVSSIVEPQISTIHIQKNTAGRKAAEILFRRIEKTELSELAIGIKLESRLVVRGSTKLGVSEDWNINDW